MRRKSSNHHYTECEALQRIRPELRKNLKQTNQLKPTDESSSDEEEDIQHEINLIMFSDEEEDLSLHETTTASRNFIPNILHSENNDSESDENREHEDYDAEADDEEFENDFDDEDHLNLSDPEILEQNTISAGLDVPKEKDDESQGEEGDSFEEEVADNAAVQVPVIQHDGCCATHSPSGPRRRLGARSLPGRPIENRNMKINVPRPTRSIPGRLAHTGEVIRYFTGFLENNQEVWLKATVQNMYMTVQQRHPTHYNVINERGEEKSLELLPGSDGWQILRGDAWVFVNAE